MERLCVMGSYWKDFSKPEDGADLLTPPQPFSKGHLLPWQLHKHQTPSPRVNLQGIYEGAIHEASARDCVSVQNT